ncbi:hypothetical protein V5H40_27050, partial [Salmonella enterica]
RQESAHLNQLRTAFDGFMADRGARRERISVSDVFRKYEQVFVLINEAAFARQESAHLNQLRTAFDGFMADRGARRERISVSD